ncbi:MAG: hypothetical protein HYZ20_12050 [Burkholderiales bacterium]|nr:hypothetical protein [Burkholderiales bacterium]
MNTPAHAPIAARTMGQLARLPKAMLDRLKTAAATNPLLQSSPAVAAGGALAHHEHPAFRAYGEAQRQAATIAGILCELPATASIARIIAEAQDEYIPNGPPMSPLTGSYFGMWSLFDACHGPGRETLGSTILACGAAIGLSAELRGLLDAMQRSRMGVYRHEGVEHGSIVLRDLITDESHRCIVASGYVGEPGQLWYQRLAPFPAAMGHAQVAMTTPYVLVSPPAAQWLAYFERVLPAGQAADRIDAAGHHLKYGPTRRYWLEFVFEAYAGYILEAVFLEGLPDIAETRPHSPRYSGRG